MELKEGGKTLLVRAGVGWQPGVVGEMTVQVSEATSEGHALKNGQPLISRGAETETRFYYPPFLIENGVRSGPPSASRWHWHPRFGRSMRYQPARKRVVEFMHQCARRHALRRAAADRDRELVVPDGPDGPDVGPPSPPAGEFVALSVADTGSGMSPSVASKSLRSFLHHQGGRRGGPVLGCRWSTASSSSPVGVCDCRATKGSAPRSTSSCPATPGKRSNSSLALRQCRSPRRGAPLRSWSSTTSRASASSFSMYFGTRLPGPRGRGCARGTPDPGGGAPRSISW